MDLYEFEEEQEEKKYGIRRDFEEDEQEYEVASLGDEEPIYEKEIKAFERVSKQSKLYELITDPKNLTKKDRFLIEVHKISKNFDDEKMLKISETDINTMLEKTQKILNLEYKNPTAYILGYIGSKGGKGLDTNIIEDVILKVLPKIKNTGVEPPDFIRYCRYWVKYI